MLILTYSSKNRYNLISIESRKYMKKRSGFTLIELLAVIVILAIIALIATPMVLKYIQNAKEQSGEQSIKAMVKAA